MPDRLLISQREAARRLGVSRLTLIGEIERGRLRYVLVGSRRKFKPEDLTIYVERVRREIAGFATFLYPETFGPPAPPAPLKIPVGAPATEMRPGC